MILSVDFLQPRISCSGTSARVAFSRHKFARFLRNRRRTTGQGILLGCRVGGHGCGAGCCAGGRGMHAPAFGWDKFTDTLPQSRAGSPEAVSLAVFFFPRPSFPCPLPPPSLVSPSCSCSSSRRGFMITSASSVRPSVRPTLHHGISAGI